MIKVYRHCFLEKTPKFLQRNAVSRAKGSVARNQMAKSKSNLVRQRTQTKASLLQAPESPKRITNTNKYFYTPPLHNMKGSKNSQTTRNIFVGQHNFESIIESGARNSGYSKYGKH